MSMKTCSHNDAVVVYENGGSLCLPCPFCYDRTRLQNKILRLEEYVKDLEGTITSLEYGDDE